MDGVSTREHRSRQKHDVADFERSNHVFSNWRIDSDFSTRPGEAGLIEHRNNRMRRIAVEPLRDRAVRGAEHDAETTEGPAVVGDGHKKARRQSIERADLAANQGHLAAKSHRTDVERIHRRHDRRLELTQPRIGIHVVQRAKELLLGMPVARRAIAADAHANRAGTAALALRVPDRVENALSDTLERAIGAAEMRQFRGQGILGVGVLAAATLEDQLDLDVVSLPLIEMNDRCAGSEIVAGICSGNRIDRIGTQFSATCRFRDGFADLAAHPDLIRADRHVHVKGRHARVLADGALVIDRQVDVLRDDRQRLRGPSAFRLGAPRVLHRRAHIGRQVGRGPHDQLKDAVEK